MVTDAGIAMTPEDVAAFEQKISAFWSTLSATEQGLLREMWSVWFAARVADEPDVRGYFFPSSVQQPRADLCNPPSRAPAPPAPAAPTPYPRPPWCR